MSSAESSNSGEPSLLQIVYEIFNKEDELIASFPIYNDKEFINFINNYYKPADQITKEYIRNILENSTDEYIEINLSDDNDKSDSFFIRLEKYNPFETQYLIYPKDYVDPLAEDPSFELIQMTQEPYVCVACNSFDVYKFINKSLPPIKLKLKEVRNILNTLPALNINPDTGFAFVEKEEFVEIGNWKVSRG
jgi:hypothetical protein